MWVSLVIIFTQSFCDKVAKYGDLAMLMKLTYSLERIAIIPVIISISGLILLESKSALEHIVEEAEIVRIMSIVMIYFQVTPMIPQLIIPS